MVMFSHESFERSKENGYGYQIKSPTVETHIICHMLYMDDFEGLLRPRQLIQLIKTVELF